jgi:hypothetical protein
VCGNCQCKSRRGDLPLIYTGRWCECDDSRCPSFNGAVCGGKMLKNTKNKSFVYLNYLSVFATKDGTGAIEEVTITSNVVSSDPALVRYTRYNIL